MGKAEFQRSQGFYKTVSASLAGNRDAMVRENTWRNLMAESRPLQGATFKVVTQFLAGQQALNPTEEKGHDFFSRSCAEGCV